MCKAYDHSAHYNFIAKNRVSRGHDDMVVGFTTTVQSVLFTTKVVSSNPTHGEVCSIQHYVIRFDGYLRQVNGFLQVL